MSEQNNNWERGVLEKTGHVGDSRAASRTALEHLFKVLTFGYLFIVLFLFMGGSAQVGWQAVGQQAYCTDRVEWSHLGRQQCQCR